MRAKMGNKFNTCGYERSQLLFVVCFTLIMLSWWQAAAVALCCVALKRRLSASRRLQSRARLQAGRRWWLLATRTVAEQRQVSGWPRSMLQFSELGGTSTESCILAKRPRCLVDRRCLCVTYYCNLSDKF